MSRAKKAKRTRSTRLDAAQELAATSEILRIIASSQGDAKAVFDAILEKATQLCGAHLGVLNLYDGRMMRTVAQRGGKRQFAKWVVARGDFAPAGLIARMVTERRPARIADIRRGPSYRARSIHAVNFAELGGARSLVSVPLVAGRRVLGALAIYRPEVRPFTAKQVGLVKGFADQAVIAVENARLFNETREALERQKATADILRVIAGSPDDIQPVLDAMAEAAARLCGANDVIIRRVDGERLRIAAHFGPFPVTVEAHSIRGSVGGRAVLERRTIHVEDITSAASRAEYPEAPLVKREGEFRTLLAVPLVRNDVAIGMILLRRMEAKLFSAQQVALLESFADQAVIAIENARLFNETREALERQTAISEILEKISGSPTDVAPVLAAVAERAARLCEGEQSTVLMLEDGNHLRPRFTYSSDKGPLPNPDTLVTLDRGYVTGRAAIDGVVINVEDVAAVGDTEYPAGRENQQKLGYRSFLAAPMMRAGRAIGVIAIWRRFVRPFSDKHVALAKTFADQAAIAIENVRLFNEIREKSRQLETANQHKSEFLANMSHELRTPLNAIIGFSEVLMERMFGEVNEKQADYLKDIHESGRHLLSLINDILDLSKIEAGRMELERSRFHLPSAIGNAMTLVRERAERHGIRLDQEIDARLGDFDGDERKVKQMLLNLLSNAVKFTPDGGRVGVAAKLDTDKVEIAVRDTGVGIAPEDQALLFEEFRQVGRDGTRKAEGTGLGLALTRKFAELHGGTIRVQSAPGSGSTFTVSLPLRPG